MVKVRLLVVSPDSELGPALAGEGRAVECLASGHECLLRLTAGAPDLVVVDQRLADRPASDLVAAVRTINRELPIVLVQRSYDADELLRVANLGRVFFLRHPFDDPLPTITAALAGRAPAEDLEQLLYRERYHSGQQELAFRKELNILCNDFHQTSFGVDNWLLQAAYHPLDIMCGDSYVVRRTPDGDMLVFLADAMGKGLAASITSMTCASFVNAQVDVLPDGRRFSLERFARRFVRSIRSLLLEDEVLSFSLTLMKHDGRSCEQVSFSMPPMLLWAGEGGVRRIGCNNPPLSRYNESLRIASHSLVGVERILLATDGLGEAAAVTGGQFRSLLDAAFAASASPERLMARFRAATTGQEDDLTLLWLSRSAATDRKVAQLVLPPTARGVEAACGALDRALACELPGIRDEVACELADVWRELLLNAYEHGALALDGETKQALMADDLYDDYLACCEEDAAGSISALLEVREFAGDQLFKLTVSDPGSGFAGRTTGLAPPPADRLCGRGLFMVRRRVDLVYFNERGNTVIILKTVQREQT